MNKNEHEEIGMMLKHINIKLINANMNCSKSGRIKKHLAKAMKHLSCLRSELDNVHSFSSDFSVETYYGGNK